MFIGPGPIRFEIPRVSVGLKSVSSQKNTETETENNKKKKIDVRTENAVQPDSILGVPPPGPAPPPSPYR